MVNFQLKALLDGTSLELRTQLGFTDLFKSEEKKLLGSYSQGVCLCVCVCVYVYVYVVCVLRVRVCVCILYAPMYINIGTYIHTDFSYIHISITIHAWTTISTYGEYFLYTGHGRRSGEAAGPFHVASIPE